jgi:hypothetical protein
MSNHTHPVSRFPWFRRFWKPAAVTGVGGTTLVLWFEEIMAVTADFIGVILIAILGGLICLFDNIIFKSRTPCPKDLQDTSNKGAKNPYETK